MLYINFNLVKFLLLQVFDDKFRFIIIKLYPLFLDSSLIGNINFQAKLQYIKKGNLE